jgi:UDPglucose 6-dehydrogenase
VINEPALAEEQFFNSQVMRDLKAFKAACDVILTNRMSPELEDVTDRTYTRDLFGEN